jgi:hypothetical protein
MSEPSKQLRIRDVALDSMADENALNLDRVTRKSIAFPSVLDCDPAESDPYMPRVNKTTAASISETQSPGEKDTVARGQRCHTAGATSGPTQPSQISSTQRAAPAGLLERSKSFLPGRYTLQNGGAIVIWLSPRRAASHRIHPSQSICHLIRSGPQKMDKTRSIDYGYCGVKILAC